MHPEIAQQLSTQRGHEMRARAEQATSARMARRARRALRHVQEDADGFAVPAIPDYVDGSFIAEPAEAGGVPERPAA